MLKVREILRLHSQQGLSGRMIARSLNISPSTVGNVVMRSKVTGLSWPLPGEFDDKELLEQRLLPHHAGRLVKAAEPNWRVIYRQPRHKGVTLQLLWVGYKSTQQEGLQHSLFCWHYRQCTKTPHISMRQEHHAVRSFRLS